MNATNLNPKERINQESQTISHFTKCNEQFNCDEDELLVEDSDELISDKCFQSQSIMDENGEIITQSNNIIKIYYTKSQKKQKTNDDPNDSRHLLNQEHFSRDSMLFSQLLKNDESQSSVMSQEYDENLLDIDNIFESELLHSDQMKCSSDPILVIDHQGSNQVKKSQTIQMNSFNQKRSFCSIDKENQNLNTNNQCPKYQQQLEQSYKRNNQPHNKDSDSKSNKEISYDKKLSQIIKKISQLSPKESITQSKKQIKYQEKSIQRVLKFNPYQINKSVTQMQYNQ